MKIITMFSKKEYLVEDDEAENVARLFASGKMIELSTGAKINPRGIESIGDPELVPTWNGYLVNSDGTSFFRDGQRIYLGSENLSEITFIPNPKYNKETIPPRLLSNDLEKLPPSLFAKELSQKMEIDYKLRNAADEEAARDLRRINN